MFFPAAGSSAFSVGSCSTVSGSVVSVSVISGCVVSVVVFNSGVVVSTFVYGSFCSSELSFGISNPIKTITINQNHHFFHIFLEGFTPSPELLFDLLFSAIDCASSIVFLYYTSFFVICHSHLMLFFLSPDFPLIFRYIQFLTFRCVL